MKTLHDRLLAGLMAAGHRQVPSKSKYTTLAHRDMPGMFYFLGAAGALRKGECASRSRSIGCPAYPSAAWNEYLAMGDKALAPKEIEV